MVIFLFVLTEIISRGWGPVVSGSLVTNREPDMEDPPVSDSGELAGGSPAARSS